jgi:hypothetical protein
MNGVAVCQDLDSLSHFWPLTCVRGAVRMRKCVVEREKERERKRQRKRETKGCFKSVFNLRGDRRHSVVNASGDLVDSRHSYKRARESE